MVANKGATIVPGHGTLFTADRTAVFPASWEDFTLTGPAPDGWENVGHTSKGNQPAFSKEGGEATVLDSWLEDSVEVVYSANQWGLGVAALQVDEPNLDLAFGGHISPATGAYIVPNSNPGLAKQAFLLATDGTGSLGFHMENTNWTIGDAPSIDAAAFLELSLAAKILAANPAVIPAHPDGRPGIMAIYKTGFTASLPKISALSQASGVAGTLVTITGTNFTGVTGAAAVKFGSTNAGSYVLVDDTTIVAVVPTGSGSSPIKVTTPVGASATKPFTIS